MKANLTAYSSSCQSSRFTPHLPLHFGGLASLSVFNDSPILLISARHLLIPKKLAFLPRDTSQAVSCSVDHPSRPQRTIDLLTEEFQHSYDPGSSTSQPSDTVGLSTLARAGRMHNSVIAADVRAMVLVVLEYGYPVEDVEDVAERVIAEVSAARSCL